MSDDEHTDNSRTGYADVLDRLEPVTSRIRKRFEIDTRSLAAVRISLGLIIIADLLHRATALEAFYTDAGAYPVSAFETTYSQYDISLHALSGSLWFQVLLFGLAGVFALLLIAGYRTRLVGLVSLVFLVSIQARNPAVLNGGDRLFRVLLLVALVTPLGERWSVDALRRGSARESVASFGTAALLIQPVVVFISNAILKHQGETWYAGDALEIALANDVMTYHLGNIIIDYPGLLTVLNYIWVALLAGSVVFLLLTAGRIRAVAALAYMGAFAGMITTMAVGLFPPLLVTAVTPFLTAPFWDTLARYVPSEWAEKTPTAADLGPFGRPPVEHRLLGVLRDRGHEFAASYVVSYARSLLTIVGFLMVVWILLYSVPEVTEYELPDEIDQTNIDQQSWGLYAPNPSQSYSWYPSVAHLENGTNVSALNDGPPQFEHPEDASTMNPSFRHRKFRQKLRDDGGTDMDFAGPYADWVCRRANERYDQRVERVTVYRMFQESPVDGEREEPHRFTVIERDCSAVSAA